jgi:hypothetical protein
MSVFILVKLETRLKKRHKLPRDFGGILPYWENLDEACEQLAVKPFKELFSSTPEEVRDYVESLAKFGAPKPAVDPELWREQWFPPEEGLKTIRGLMEWVRTHPEQAHYRRLADEARSGEDVDEGVLRDLEGVEKWLVAAEKEQIRFHLDW